jgi:glycosyltransferase involved in cell wall biosynthesis
MTRSHKFDSSDPERRPLVVLSAFACHPEMSSEAGIGWLFLKHLGRQAAARDVAVVAVMNGRSAVATEASLRNDAGGPNVEVVAIDVPKFLSFLRNPRLTRLEYLVWNHKARSYLKSLERRRDIAGGWHVTFATEILPTPVAALSSRVVRIWGPVGSSGSWRVFKLFPREPGWRGEVAKQILRDSVATVLGRWNSRNIDVVLAQTADVVSRVRPEASVEVFPNVVIPRNLVPVVKESKDVDYVRPTGLRIVCAGHLVHRKRFGLAIAAMGDPRMRGAHLIIAGAPLPGTADYLPALVSKLGVADRVTFAGKLARSELMGLMEESDVFVHLAAREGAPGIVGEATMLGIPLICFEGTGSAAVARTANTSAVFVDPRHADRTTIVDAILSAAALPRTRYGGWTEDRIAEQIDKRLLQCLRE